MTLLRWLRRVGAVFAVLSLLFLAFATVVRWRGARALDRAVKDFETRVGPVDLAAYNLPPVNPETNPAPAFRRASELLGDAWWTPMPDTTEPPSAQVRNLAFRPAREWSATDMADLEQIEDLARPAREELQRALDRPGPASFGLEYTHAWDLGLPNFLSLNSLADLLVVEARQAERAGDWATVLRAGRHLGHLADIVRPEAALIFALIAQSYERRQHLVLRMVAEAPEVDLETIEAALALLQERTAAATYQRPIGGEGAFLFAVSQSHDFRPKLAVSPSSRLYLWLSGDRYVAENLTFYANSFDILRTTPYAAALWPARPDYGAWWSNDLNSFTVHFENLSARLAATHAGAQLARAALGLRRAALTSGSYPALADTRPSDFTGKPIRRVDSADGSVVLDLEGAWELWLTAVPAKPETAPSLAIEWRLPPVAAAPPS
jgi:hypothetical protein